MSVDRVQASWLVEEIGDKNHYQESGHHEESSCHVRGCLTKYWVASRRFNSYPNPQSKVVVKRGPPPCNSMPSPAVAVEPPGSGLAQTLRGSQPKTPAA